MTDGSGPDARKRRPWRENVEAVVMAVVMAILLKYFIVEAYKIPTGSMQPTLIGDEHAGIEDRILVDKLSYVLREPRRWEIAVFRYPLDRSKNFVKRIVGVGPEELRIQHGDLWRRTDGEPWTVLRRPRDVQRTVWKRIDLLPSIETPWQVVAGRGWQLRGRDLETDGPGTVAFLGAESSIVDDYMHGYPEELADLIPRFGKRSGNNTVGDLRLEGEVTARAGTEAVEVVLKEGNRSYTFHLPGPAAPADARPRIEAAGVVQDDQPDASADASDTWRLPADRPVRFAAQNMDDLLELEVDGRVIRALEVEPALLQSSAIYVQVEGAGARFEDLRPYRDIYYTGDAETRSIDVPADRFYMLGDNTQESCDSREWRYSILELEAGSELRGNLRRGENPRLVGAGDPDGPKTYFVDEWGERHWLRSGTIARRSTLRSPFVPSEMIQGKALAVFWPLDPRRGIYRFRWVN